MENCLVLVLAHQFDDNPWNYEDSSANRPTRPPSAQRSGNVFWGVGADLLVLTLYLR
jgi:hypothetical protein